MDIVDVREKLISYYIESGKVEPQTVDLEFNAALVDKIVCKYCRTIFKYDQSSRMTCPRCGWKYNIDAYYDENEHF